MYLDNAATSFPKPESVYAAHDAYLRSAGNPGRGAHRLALLAARTIFEARTSLAKFLGAQFPERLVFTPGCTASINTVLKGIGLQQGDVVVVSALEHNAVMRPLHAMQQRLGVRVHVLNYAPSRIIDLQELRDALASMKPKLCAFLKGAM